MFKERKVTLVINAQEYEVILEKNVAVDELLKLLPLKILMQDLNNNEKCYYLNKPLPSEPGNVSRVEKGDIMLYNDNCLVVFYQSFITPYQYTRLGRIKDPSSLAKNLKDKNIMVIIK